MNKPSKIKWINTKTKDKFFKTRKTNPTLYKRIDQTLKKVQNNSFYGIPIPRRLISKEWKQYSNIMKCDLYDGYRLFYTISSDTNETIILAIIIDWMTHKKYEKLFKY